MPITGSEQDTTQGRIFNTAASELREVTAEASITSKRKEVYYVSSTALLIFAISVLDTGLNTQIFVMIMLLHFCTQAEHHAPEELERQCKIINILDSKSDINVDLSLQVQDFRPKGLETSCQALLPRHKPQPNEVTCALFTKMCPIGGTKKKSLQEPRKNKLLLRILSPFTITPLCNKHSY